MCGACLVVRARKRQLERFQKKAREAEVLWNENRKLRAQLDKFQSRTKLLPFEERLNAARGGMAASNNRSQARTGRRVGRR